MSVTFSKPFELVVGPGGRDRSEEAGTGARSGGWSASRPGRAGEGEGGREGRCSGIGEEILGGRTALWSKRMKALWYILVTSRGSPYVVRRTALC